MAAEIGLADPAAYTLACAVRADSIPDWAALTAAIAGTLARHDIFSWRLAFDSAWQVTVTGGSGPHLVLKEEDLRAATPAEADAAVLSRLASERRRPVRLLAGTAPYTRVTAFRLPAPARGGEAAACVLATHHALADEHAIELLWNEIFNRAAGRAPAGGYDLRYADWAEASTSPAAAAAARQAGAEIAARLAAAGLRTPPPARPRPGPGDGYEKLQLRAEIPADLTASAGACAAALAVPATAVYAAAAAEALTASAAVPALAVNVPVTRRATTADLQTVGCYISAVPVLAQAAQAGDTGQDSVLRAYAALRFAADRPHADPATIREAAGHLPEAMVAFESPRRRRTARPVSWTALPPPDSTAKQRVSLFIAPGARGCPGEARLLWQPGALDTGSASDLAAAFLAHLTRLSAST
jgi:hypothetical protein